MNVLYVDSKAITVCPAVIFAPSRKLRVMGRTSVLTDSTKIRKGDIQLGEFAGRKCPKNITGLNEIEDIMFLSHRGSANARVNRRCLDRLKRYGVSPKRLIIISIINRDVMREEDILMLNTGVRFNCVQINLKGIFSVVLMWEGEAQREEWVIRVIIIKGAITGARREMRRGNEAGEYVNGSNETKMSAIIRI